MSFKLMIFVCLLAIACLDVINAASKLPLIGNRIVGGYNAKPGDFPHQVSVHHRILTNIICGGAILSNRWILTSAQCISFMRKHRFHGPYFVQVGKQDLDVDEVAEQSSLVESYFMHYAYNETIDFPGVYDIGLIKLDRPLRFNKRVVKINLPAEHSEPSGQSILSGWGATENDGYHKSYPHILQRIDLPIISRDECKRSIEKFVPTAGQFVDETIICTGPLTGGQSACSDDDGGPLITRNDKGESQIVGIASWGMIPCGTLGMPFVYVKVSYFIDWITDIMMRN